MACKGGETRRVDFIRSWGGRERRRKGEGGAREGEGKGSIYVKIITIKLK